MALSGFQPPLLNASLPTNYEYYTSGGISSGLSTESSTFYLNNKEIFIYSGAFHYFRVPRAYWRDRLKKIRAAGLNTVETYVPWNLHEPQSGVYDFGDGNNDMSDFLHLEEFLQMVKEEDLFAIVRSGPYICAEFEFGGFPSWLLREDEIDIRTSNSIYMNYVTRFFNVLLPILAAFQFINGGPIIMFQVENEYALSGKHDLEYLKQLRNILLNKGIKELLVTSDNPDKGTYGTIPELFLMTGNFDDDITNNLDMLAAIQPDKPRMTMEFWGGWFDFWGGDHTVKSAETFKYNYELVLKYPSSVSIYMFIGGTNFGFLNGAQNLNYDDENSDYHSITSSYDYLSPIDESGDYTDKYWATKELIAQYNPVKTLVPDPPAAPEKTSYPTLTVEKQIYLWDLLEDINPVYSSNVIPMEKLDVNDNNGQSFGYVVYRRWNLDIPANSVLQIEGRVCDVYMVLVNGVLMSPWVETRADINNTATSHTKNPEITLTDTDLFDATLDIIVENWGRVNSVVYKQYKGLWQGGVKLNGNYLYDWWIYPLEFKKSWMNSYVANWSSFDTNSVGPSLYKTTLEISGNPVDTFIDMETWSKGIVIVNGFVLGRYAKMGPIQTLYLPAPLLQSGTNNIYIFDHYKPDTHVYFSNSHIYKSN